MRGGDSWAFFHFNPSYFMWAELHHHNPAIKLCLFPWLTHSLQPPTKTSVDGRPFPKQVTNFVLTCSQLFWFKKKKKKRSIPQESFSTVFGKPGLSFAAWLGYCLSILRPRVLKFNPHCKRLRGWNPLILRWDKLIKVECDWTAVKSWMSSQEWPAMKQSTCKTLHGSVKSIDYSFRLPGFNSQHIHSV